MTYTPRFFLKRNKEGSFASGFRSLVQVPLFLRLVIHAYRDPAIRFDKLWPILEIHGHNDTPNTLPFCFPLVDFHIAFSYQYLSFLSYSQLKS